MQIQIKITTIEHDEDDGEIELRKELIFSNLDNDAIQVRIFDEDTSEDVEISVSKHDLIKAITLITS